MNMHSSYRNKNPPVMAMFATMVLVFSFVLIITTPSPSSSLESSSTIRQKTTTDKSSSRLQENILLSQYPQAILILPQQQQQTWNNLASFLKESSPETSTLLASALQGIEKGSASHFHLVTPVDGSSLESTKEQSRNLRKAADTSKDTETTSFDATGRKYGLKSNATVVSSPRVGISYSFLGFMVLLIWGLVVSSKSKGRKLDDAVQTCLNTVLQRKRLENELAYDIAYTSDVSEVGYGSVVSSWPDDLEWESTGSTDTFDL